MKTVLNLLACLLLLPPAVQAQTDSLNAYALDFWLGKWNLQWKTPQGETVMGKNHVIRILDGQVIQENFSSPTGFEGKSWSTFNPESKLWHQTWVDNQGGYLTFAGKRAADTVIFAMAPTLTDSSYLERRMIFYNIEYDRFNWDWQARSRADGPWEARWQILYTRQED